MTELRDIEESIRYSCRHNPRYGEDLIERVRRSFRLTKKVDMMIEYLNQEIKRTNVESYRSLCKQELVIYEGILKTVDEIQNPNEVSQ